TGNPATLEQFIEGAQETKGSWWPDWAEWIAANAPSKIPVKGKRVPGGKGDRAIEDAPGRYVRSR
ncbi:MAG: class I poly(R)-hydroxyalkanoic acid synthase, partial [Novosphingobium sp.]|nr:class I poly(R)-hydroxyalkanoic acid synthase [Novosphingobium sp.]